MQAGHFVNALQTMGDMTHHTRIAVDTAVYAILQERWNMKHSSQRTQWETWPTIHALQ